MSRFALNSPGFKNDPISHVVFHNLDSRHHGSAKTAQVLFIPAHNLSSAATIRLERGTTLGGADVYAGADLPAWPFTPLDNVYTGRHFGVCIITAAATSARYTRIRIKDAGNHSELINRPGLYQRIHQIQSGLADELQAHTSQEQINE